MPGLTPTAPGQPAPRISRTPTPHPGDLLSTGTPSGYARRPPRLLRPGDAVQTEGRRLGIRAT
ncbi:fumarylacetoacetate hydrolase family protein [Streptomyces sp. NPDC013157]|uniref:fumarylacetoacetate hydrolase family protein n=1 Tax=Streptomyces sp. NPDC013157 TaxID=3364861 RepID=UPI0036C579B0